MGNSLNATSVNTTKIKNNHETTVKYGLSNKNVSTTNFFNEPKVNNNVSRVRNMVNKLPTMGPTIKPSNFFKTATESSAATFFEDSNTPATAFFNQPNLSIPKNTKKSSYTELDNFWSNNVIIKQTQYNFVANQFLACYRSKNLFEGDVLKTQIEYLSNNWDQISPNKQSEIIPALCKIIENFKNLEELTIEINKILKALFKTNKFVIKQIFVARLILALENLKKKRAYKIKGWDKLLNPFIVELTNYAEKTKSPDPRSILAGLKRILKKAIKKSSENYRNTMIALNNNKNRKKILKAIKKENPKLLPSLSSSKKKVDQIIEANINNITKLFSSTIKICENILEKHFPKQKQLIMMAKALFIPNKKAKKAKPIQNYISDTKKRNEQIKLLVQETIDKMHANASSIESILKEIREKMYQVKT